MKRRNFIKTASTSSLVAFGMSGFKLQETPPFKLEIEQLTKGVKHHLFGYIGQSLTIPWNLSGSRILTLRSSFHDHLPDGSEPADVALVNLEKKEGEFYKVEKIDESLGWNIQQGTMFYWNPDNPESQFFFNDRDPKTGKVFTVLYDIEKGARIHEFKYEDTPVGNGGICPVGKYFTAINYARMARLRPVTGYKGAFDWTEGVAAPEDDGIFIIDIKSGKKKVLVSFAKLKEEIEKAGYDTFGQSLFINHTLWSRNGKYIYFFVRAGWRNGDDRNKRINVACSINSDGTGLSVGHPFIGGHPEWGEGSQMIGRDGEKQIIYDILTRKIVGSIATSEAIPNPEGDISLSPNAQLFVNGYGVKNENYYCVVRMNDDRWVRSKGIYKGTYLKGPLRIDPAPRWNRENNQILVPGITDDGTRQLFRISVK